MKPAATRMPPPLGNFFWIRRRGLALDAAAGDGEILQRQGPGPGPRDYVAGHSHDTALLLGIENHLGRVWVSSLNLQRPAVGKNLQIDNCVIAGGYQNSVVVVFLGERGGILDCGE